MKNYKLSFIVFFLLIFIPVGFAVAQIRNFEADGVFYNIIDSTNIRIIRAPNSHYSGNIVIPAQVIHDGTPYAVTEVSISAFLDCTKLTSITIPEGVTKIRALAFSGCSGLTSVTIPNSVNSIEFCTFFGCSGLTSIDIPPSVIRILDGTFSGCSGLTSVTLPHSIIHIGCGAFADCDNLKSIICLAPRPPQTCLNAFANISFKNCTVYVPKGKSIKKQYQAHPSWNIFSISEMAKNKLNR